tara:strand:+ start:73 stop:816 length:744 start_codon:yes stop_codon:yes gene_type:complete
MIKPSIFKFERLKVFYSKLQEKKEILTFNEYNGQNCFLIRHDVDYDINKAYEMAQLENEMGIKATYFILLSTNNYNVFTFDNQKMICAIKEMGHEIGLHFDPSKYTNDINQHFENQILLLNKIIDNSIYSVSLHNPSMHNKYPNFSGYNNAYSKRFFNSSNYLSDARFNFRNKEPFDFIETIDDSVTQISLHPIHYSIEGEANYMPILKKIYHKNLLEFKNEFSLNIKAAEELCSTNFIDDILKLIK